LPTATPAPRTLREAVEDCQRQSIQAALEQHRGHWANAARQLGLDASNLHKLARRLGLK
jgi:anaerobic nitric oxide reductase transcription regulator